MEQAGRSSHYGISLFGLLLVTHTKVTARALQVQDVVVLRPSVAFRRRVVKLETGVLLQHVPITFLLQLIDDVVGRRSHDKRGFEFDIALLFFEVAEHLGDDLEVAFVDHARADKAEVDLLVTTVEGQFADRIVGVALGDIDVCHIGVRYHRLTDGIEVHDHFGVVLRVRIRRQRRLFAGFVLPDARCGTVDLPLLQPWGNVYFACPVKLADSDDKMLLFLEFKIPDQTMYVLDGAEEEDLVEVAASFKPQPLVPLDDEENVKIEELNSGNTIFLGLVYTFYIGTQKRLQEFIDQIGLQKWELMDLNKVLEVNALIQSENQDSFAAFGMARKDGLEYILFMNDYRRKLEYMCVHVNNETQALSFSKKNSLKIETLFDRHVSAVMDDVIINYSAAHEMRLI